MGEMVYWIIVPEGNVLKRILMNRQFYIITGLAFLLWASNTIFNKIEERLRQPYHFVFDLAKVEWPKTKPGAPTPPIREDDISEVDIAGTFNGWGVPGTFDAELEGHAGWGMEKTGPGRWELSERLPIPEGMNKHFYKFRIKPKSSDVLKRFALGVDWNFIWLHDSTNKDRVDDGHHGFNSGVKVRSVELLGWIIRVVLAFALFLALGNPLIKLLIRGFSRLPIPFVAKVSLLTLTGVSLTIFITIGVACWAIYRMYLQRDSEMANLLLNIYKKDIVAAIHANPRTESLSESIARKSRWPHGFGAFRTGLNGIALLSSQCFELLGSWPSTVTPTDIFHSNYYGVSLAIKSEDPFPVNIILQEAPKTFDGQYGEVWTSLVNPTTSWAVITLPFSKFKKFSLWQPPMQDNDGVFNIETVIPFGIFLLNVSSGSVWIDDIELLRKDPVKKREVVWDFDNGTGDWGSSEIEFNGNNIKDKHDAVIKINNEMGFHGKAMHISFQSKKKTNFDVWNIWLFKRGLWHSRLDKPTYVTNVSGVYVGRQGFAYFFHDLFNKFKHPGSEPPMRFFDYPIHTARKVVAHLLFDFGGGMGFSGTTRTDLMIYIAKVSILIFIITIVCALGVGIVFGRFILEPVRKLTDGFLRVRAGNYSTEVIVKTRDELSSATAIFNDMVRGLRERELIKDTFGRYVSKQIADKILKDPEKLDMIGERREVSIIFADIRDFTPYSETHTPEEVVQTLNQYFSRMIDVIFKYEGTLDKFIGDCVMAVFGAPLDQPDHAERAVRCAWEMQKVLAEFNKERVSKNELPIKIGIGVNSGEAVSGNVGSEKRTEFSVVGDSVNLASRLEDLAKEGQILIGPGTYEKVKGFIDTKALPPQTVKGKAEPVRLYEITSLKGETT